VWWAVCGGAVALLVVITQWPAAAALLRFAPLSPALLAAALAWGLGSLVWFEGMKAARLGRST